MARKIFNRQLAFEIMLSVFLVILSVFINLILINKIPVLQQWDNIFYDLESSLTTPSAEDKVVIVAIDDASLTQLGRWPWSRAIHADLIDKLTAANVAGVAMDILFMEPDLAHPENDQLLVSAIRRNGRVILPVLTTIQDEYFTVTKPLPDIANAAAQLAHVNMHFDSQGIARKLDLELKLDNEKSLPALSLALSRQQESHNPSLLAGLESILVNFSGPPGHFQHISFIDVLQDKPIQQQLSGKIVFIGVTATGLGSSIATPVSSKLQLMSGIEFQANAFSTIQSGRIVQAMPWTAYLLISVLLIPVSVFVFRFLRPAYALIVLIVFSMLTVMVSFLLLNDLLLWFTPLPTLICLVLSYPLWSKQQLEWMQHSLFKVHEKSTATLKAIAEAVVTTDHNNCIEFMNPAAEIMFDRPLSAVKQQPFSELFQVLDDTSFELIGVDSLATANKNTEVQAIRNLKGEEIAVRITSSDMHDENKRSIGVVYAFNDLTEIIRVHQKIAFVATHDALTKLPNRVLLQDRLQQAVMKAKRESLNFALLFIDLDGFKKVNDAMGHDCGDILLQTVANRLRNWVRKSDTISRWGGDEFIILLENLALPSDAADVAGKIIVSLSTVVLLNQQEVFVTPSIGISLYPDDGLLAAELIAKSDTAMYNVKKNGKNNYCFYSQKLDNQAKEKLMLEAELRKALEAGEFEMYYQPQIDISSNQLIGTEALIRWNHPKRGLVPPDKFIPLAEEIGLIVTLGEWIIETVCLQLKTWEIQGFKPIKVAINLSAQQFVDKDLVSIISREINKHDLAPELIQVEITESMMLNDIEQVIKILAELKSAGISIAIDDFGTGYSSLEYLKRLPIDKLKIDKSFIDSVLHNSDDASIVQAVIALGHNMNMQIIAEGVENEQQVDFLHDKKCDFAQGYFYSKALPAQKMGLLFEKNK